MFSLSHTHRHTVEIFWTLAYISFSICKWDSLSIKCIQTLYNSLTTLHIWLYIRCFFLRTFLLYNQSLNLSPSSIYLSIFLSTCSSSIYLSTCSYLSFFLHVAIYVFLSYNINLLLRLLYFYLSLFIFLFLLTPCLIALPIYISLLSIYVYLSLTHVCQLIFYCLGR